MDLIVDVLKVLFRVGTILPIMLLVTLFMGKRSIGELPVFDFLVILTLGSVVGADIAEPSVNHLPTVAAVIAIALLQKLIAWWKIKNHRVGRFLSFEPTMVMYDGQFHLQNMKKSAIPLIIFCKCSEKREFFGLKMFTLLSLKPMVSCLFN